MKVNPPRGDRVSTIDGAVPVIAVVGGGQLARMMAAAAIDLGLHLRILAQGPTDPAAQVLTDVVIGHATNVDDLRALTQPLGAAAAQVLTFEHEHIPAELLTALDGVDIHPSPDALRCAQDKAAMRYTLTALGVPCPSWQVLPRDPDAAVHELSAFLERHQGQGMVKTARGGYDGKGVRLIRHPTDVADWIQAAAREHTELLVEALVPFVREVAVLVARRPSGQIAVWPIVESIQVDGVCAEVIAPAPGLSARQADQIIEIATTIARELDVTGVMAVEMFELADGRVLVNELAMRPHNSGHWTIAGSHTSQFAQHLRAVMDLPLGPTDPYAPWSVMVNIMGSSHTPVADLPAALAAVPEAVVSLYGKEPRPGRKLGHVTVIGNDRETVQRRARLAAAILRGVEYKEVRA